MSIDKLGDALGTAIQDKDRMKTELITPGTIHSRFLLKDYKLKVRNTRCLVESRSIGTTWIWGHPPSAIYGTSTWGDATIGSWTTEETRGEIQALADVGRIELCRFLNSNAAASSPESANPPSYLAVGTDDTAFSVDDKQLGAELQREEATITTTDKKTTYQIELKVTDDLTIGETIKEVGLLEDGSANHTIDTSQGATTVDLTLGTHASTYSTSGTISSGPYSPYLISGTITESDGSTAISETKVYVVNLSTEEMGYATTNASGQYIYDVANLGYSNEDVLLIQTDKLFGRYVISDLATINTKEYRFTYDVEYFDMSVGDAMIVDSGLNLIRDWFAGTSVNPPSDCGWGVGATALSRSDTYLEGEQERNVFTVQNRIKNVINYETILTTAEMNDLDIRKSGLFNAGNVEGTNLELDTDVGNQTANFTID